MSSLRRGATLGDSVEEDDISNNVEEDDIQNYSDNYDISTYSPEEEQILNSIRLPVPITPISDTEDYLEKKDNKSDVGVDYIQRKLPNTMTDFTKYDPSTNSDSESNDE